MSKKKTNKKGRQKGFNIELLEEYSLFRESECYEFICNSCARNEKLKSSFLFTMEQLEKHWKPAIAAVPDYSGFRGAMKKVISEKTPESDAFDYNLFSNSLTVSAKLPPQAAIMYVGGLYTFLVDYAEKDGGKIVSDELAAKLGLKLKLMISLYDESNRERALRNFRFLSCIDGFNTDEEYVDGIDSSTDSLNLINKLQVALNKDFELEANRDSELEANRLIGALSTRKEELDAGEYEYFSALVYNKSARKYYLRKALKELKKIPRDSKEYALSFGIRAEIYAKLGDYDGFLNTLAKAETLSFESAVYYLQLMLLNLESKRFKTLNSSGEYNIDSVVEKCISSVNEQFSDQKPDMSKPQCFYILENVCEAARKILNYFRLTDFELDASEVKDSGLSLSPEREAELMEIINQAPAEIYKQQVIIAASFGADYCDSLLEYIIILAYRYSLDKAVECMNYIMAVNARDSKTTLLSLKIAYAFLDDGDFALSFENDIENFKNHLSEDDYKAWLMTAYYSALRSRSDALDRLDEEIKNSFNNIGELEEDKAYNAVYGRLSKEGRLLLQSAYENYNSAIDTDYGWKDAGMLSLGFFRIIELEFKEQLIEKALKNNPDFETKVNNMRGAYPYNSNKAKYKATFSDTGKEFNFNETINCIQNKPMTMERIDLTLFFLSEECNVDSDIEAYVNDIRNVFYSALTDAGKEAAKKDEIRKYISYDKRDEFRNPPAHANYLPIDKVEDCKEWVFEALSKLFNDWMKPSDAE